MAKKIPHGKIINALPRGTANVLNKKLRLKTITFEDLILLNDALLAFQRDDRKEWEQDACTACAKFH